MQYFGADGLGSVRQIYDASGALIGSSRYDPYGNVMSQSGTATSAYGFTGEWTDATGLVHLRARYYSAAQGRFITRDVWEGDPNAPMSYNAWLYAYANSVNLTDASGHDPWWCDKYTGTARQSCLEEYNSRAFPDPVDVGFVPYFNQFDQTGGGSTACGPTALLMVLGKWGINTSVQEIIDRTNMMMSPSQGGFDPTCGKNADPTNNNAVCMSAAALEAVAKSYGLTTIAHDNWTWYEVRAQLAVGHPLIADINVVATGPSAGVPLTTPLEQADGKYFGHFVVIIKVEWANKVVHYHNPYVKPGNDRRLDLSLFELAWSGPVDKNDPLQSGGHVRWAMAAYKN
jgi:RHS repeat-associated protein